MRYLILIIILASMISCKIDGKIDKKDDKTGNKTDIKQTPYSLKTYQAIVPADEKMDWAFGKDYKNWTPSDNDIEAAEKLLSQGFDDQARGTVNRMLGKKLEDYNRQFVGGINANGDKIIWINCFCKAEEKTFKGWKDNIVYVADGGNCFFNVTVNITKNTLTDFRVNGNA